MPLTKVTGKGISNLDELSVNTASPSDNVEINPTADGKGITLKTSSNIRPYLNLDSNRSGAGNNIGQINILWNGTDVARIVGVAGSDTTNKDDGHITFQTASAGSPTERLRILSTGGITFNGDTATANALDDYEEGTWTPAIVGASNTPTYYNQVGRYTKIGRSVTIQCFLQTNVSPTYSNANTQFKISGVPFNLLAIGYTGGQGTVNSQSFRFTSGDNDQGSTGSHLTVGINADEQLIFHNTGSGQTRGSVENSGTTSGFIIEATLTYFTDA